MKPLIILETLRAEEEEEDEEEGGAGRKRRKSTEVVNPLWNDAGFFFPVFHGKGY